MRYREIANKLALDVSRMSKGELRGYALEGAVSKIELALEEARNETFDEVRDFIDKLKKEELE